MHFEGVVIGAVSFLSIGLCHPLVIWAEYRFSKRCWPVFLIAGLIMIGIALFLRDLTFSACLGVIGMSFLWSIKELFDQEKRVKKGWFPVNPDRKR